MRKFPTLAVALFVATSAGAALAQAPGSTPGFGIDAREANQQQRIGQGVASGQLTAGETARLERREASINAQESRMRARNGGELSARDRRVLNRRLDNTSAAIFDKKHNNRVR